MHPNESERPPSWALPSSMTHPTSQSVASSEQFYQRSTPQLCNGILPLPLVSPSHGFSPAHPTRVRAYENYEHPQISGFQHQSFHGASFSASPMQNISLLPSGFQHHPIWSPQIPPNSHLRDTFDNPSVVHGHETQKTYLQTPLRRSFPKDPTQTVYPIQASYSRKPRHKFTQDQLQILTDARIKFKLTGTQKHDLMHSNLATELNISKQTVKNWFTNHDKDDITKTTKRHKTTESADHSNAGPSEQSTAESLADVPPIILDEFVAVEVVMLFEKMFGLLGCSEKDLGYNMYRKEYWKKKAKGIFGVITFKGDKCRSEWKMLSEEDQNKYQVIAVQKLREFREGKVMVSLKERRRIYRKGKELLYDAQKYFEKANIPFISMLYMSKAKTPLHVKASNGVAKTALSNLSINNRIRSAWMEALTVHQRPARGGKTVGRSPTHLDIRRKALRQQLLRLLNLAVKQVNTAANLYKQIPFSDLQNTALFSFTGWEDYPESLRKLKTPPWNTEDIDFFEANWDNLRVACRSQRNVPLSSAINSCQPLSSEIVEDDDFIHHEGDDENNIEMNTDEGSLGSESDEEQYE
ncbi:hypothetical protein BC829DRAFT_436536 [Chytridium lagenaria]|nr:hypothetical protein BC829DRAFT_436536 [Chytridium lagenaria]